MMNNDIINRLTGEKKKTIDAWPKSQYLKTWQTVIEIAGQ